jgi:hypothetical protein
LFLGPAGEPYQITPNGEPGQKRHVCRAVLEIYRKLFRYADIKGLSTQSARLTLMSRMYARGADEDQVGSSSASPTAAQCGSNCPGRNPCWPNCSTK